jgi:hypothetical protein
MPQSKGDYRVGTDFNPSGNNHVDEIKVRASELIDYIEDEIATDTGDDELNGEVRRLKALAQTAIEEAAMWAVKAVTKRPRS